jgi:hypothetical protein
MGDIELAESPLQLILRHQLPLWMEYVARELRSRSALSKYPSCGYLYAIKIGESDTLTATDTLKTHQPDTFPTEIESYLANGQAQRGL